MKLAGKLESSGTFTVNPEYSFKSLKVFQDSSECLLKFVQAAVRAQAESLEIKIGLRSVEIVFDPESEVSADTLLRQLANPTKDFAQLSQALRGSLQAGFREVRFTSWSNGAGRSLRLSEGRVQESEPFVWPWQGESGVRIRLQRETGFFSFRSLRARGSESDALFRRCRISPIRISSSGLLVNGPDFYKGYRCRPTSVVEAVIRSQDETPGLCGPTSDYRHTHAMALSEEGALERTKYFAPDNPGQPFLFLTLNYRTSQKLLNIHPFLSATQKRKRSSLQACEALLAYSHFGPDSLTLTPVIDGVCCEELVVPDILQGVTAVVACEDVKTDFSGFRLIDDDHLQALTEYVEAHCADALGYLRGSPFSDFGPT